jgi:hypothetical protein
MLLFSSSPLVPGSRATVLGFEFCIIRHRASVRGHRRALNPYTEEISDPGSGDIRDMFCNNLRDKTDGMNNGRTHARLTACGHPTSHVMRTSFDSGIRSEERFRPSLGKVCARVYFVTAMPPTRPPRYLHSSSLYISVIPRRSRPPPPHSHSHDSIASTHPLVLYFTPSSRRHANTPNVL